MTKAAQIRSFAEDGVTVSECAKRVGVPYQHAYNVLREAGMLPVTSANAASPKRRTTAKPPLLASQLVEAGFRHACSWTLTDSRLSLEPAAPVEHGVYAFVAEGRALYVGVATKGLKKRLNFYVKPGPTQGTSLRLNARLREELAGGRIIHLYVAFPPDFSWNGLPMNGAVGLEHGLIHTFNLPWNVRGA